MEATVCTIGQINDKNDYKKRKNLELRLGLRNLKLYPDYEIKQTNIVFNFLGDFNTTLKKELSDLAHKKDVTKVLTNCQKLPSMPEVFSVASGEERQSEWCVLFSPLRDSPSRLRRSILSPLTRKKPLAPRVVRSRLYHRTVKSPKNSTG